MVGALLAKYAGIIEVQHVDELLPTLRRKPGLTSWQVRSRAMFSSHSQVCNPANEIVSAWTDDLQGVSPIMPSMFPSSDPHIASQLKRRSVFDPFFFFFLFYSSIRC